MHGPRQKVPSVSEISPSTRGCSHPKSSAASLCFLLDTTQAGTLVGLTDTWDPDFSSFNELSSAGPVLGGTWEGAKGCMRFRGSLHPSSFSLELGLLAPAGPWAGGTQPGVGGVLFWLWEKQLFL